MNELRKQFIIKRLAYCEKQLACLLNGPANGWAEYAVPRLHISIEQDKIAIESGIEAHLPW